MIQNPSGYLKGSRLDFRYTKKILMFYQSTESIIRVCHLNGKCLIIAVCRLFDSLDYSFGNASPFSRTSIAFCTVGSSRFMYLTCSSIPCIW